MFVNSSRLVSAIVALMGLFFAAYLGVTVATSSGNALGEVMKLSCFLIFVIALVVPRGGILLLLFMAFYLDSVKRLLILFDGTSMMDVTYVLAAAPLAVLGLLIGCFMRRLFQHRFLEFGEVILSLGIGFLVIFNAAVEFRASGFGVGALAVIANNAAYASLGLVFRMIYSDTKPFHRLTALMIALAVPVAIYGIWQSVFGLTTFEKNYLTSGLTTLVGLLDDAVVRPFSTMNSGHAFSITMASMFALSYGKLVFEGLSRSALTAIYRSLVPMLFFVAAIMSLGRTSWFMMLFCVAAIHCFSSKSRTVLVYCGSIAVVVAMFFSSDFLLPRLASIEAALPSDSGFSQRAFTTGTFSDRLYSYRNNFENPDLRTAFGNPNLTSRASDVVSKDETVHDALGQALARFGIVGTLVFLLLGAYGAFFIHKHILRISDARDRGLCVTCTSVMFGILVSGLFSGTNLAVFPLNFFFWTMGAITLTTIHLNGLAARSRPGGTPLRVSQPTPLAAGGLARMRPHA